MASRTPPWTQVLVVATVVLGCITGLSYALGLGVGGRATGVGTDWASTPTTRPGTGTTQPPPPDASPPPASPTRPPEPSRTSGVPVPPSPTDGDGPYGTRQTTGSQAVALTFDDGPDPLYTPRALDLLRYYGVRATFCVLGTNAQRYPNLIRAIAADGHALCNHSWSHDLNLGDRGRLDIEADLLRTNAAIRAAVPGAPIAYYRQPGGNWTPRLVTVARDLGMDALHWSVDPRDWLAPGPLSIAATVNSRTAPGSIVLLHDAGGDREGTILALHSILPELSRRFELTALRVSAAMGEPVGGRHDAVRAELSQTGQPATVTR